MTEFLKGLGKILAAPIAFFFPLDVPPPPPIVAPKWVPPPRQKPIIYHKKDAWRKGIKRNVTIVGPEKGRH